MRVVASAKRADDERVFVPVTNNDGWKSVRTCVENQMIFCVLKYLSTSLKYVWCFVSKPNHVWYTSFFVLGAQDMAG